MIRQPIGTRFRGGTGHSCNHVGTEKVLWRLLPLSQLRSRRNLALTRSPGMQDPADGADGESVTIILDL
jgi:hypothetical protein